MSVPPDIVIYVDDGVPEGGPEPDMASLGDDDVRGGTPPPRRSGSAGRLGAVLAVGAVLIFGFGVAVGSHAHGTEVAGTPVAATTLSGAAVSTGSPSGPGPGTSSSTDSGGSGTGGGTETFDTAPNTSSDPAPGAQAPPVMAWDMCEQQEPVGAVTGAQPLPTGADLSLITGVDARLVDPASAPKQVPLLDEAARAAREYVAELVGSAGHYIARVSSCANPGVSRLVEITGSAGAYSMSPIKATIPAEAQLGGLLAGGTTPWAELYQGTQVSDGANSTMRASPLALDGSSPGVALPPAFYPVGAYRNLVVGILQPFTSTPAPIPTGDIIQVFDVTKGSIVGQLGSYVGRYVMGDGYLLWEPQCETPCEIHRYDIASGKGAVVGPAPDIGNEDLVRWAAVSPDGKRVAMVVPQGNVTRSADGGYQIEGSSASSVVVLDVETGTTSVAHGVDLPMSFTSVEFSPDSKWLVVALATRSGGAVVAYDARMRGPYLVASLPDVAGWGIPLAVLPN